MGYGTKYKEISIDGGMKKKRAFKHPHRIIYGTALICFDNVQTTERINLSTGTTTYRKKISNVFKHSRVIFFWNNTYMYYISYVFQHS
jgi:hypothetical protein